MFHQGDRDVVVRREPSPHTACRPRLRCSQLFMIYQARLGKLMLSALDFIRITEIHNRNVIMFRDIQMMNYQRGISAEIESMSKFLEWQKAQRELYFPHVRTTYCLGVSAGAYAAIASGYFLRVPVVWAFAPPMTRVKDGAAPPPEDDQISERCADLAGLLREGNGVTEYRIYYNESQERDRLAAQRLADCQGVRLFPQPGKGHSVVVTMNQMGRLERLLVPFEGV